jgi:hypothetical protein
MGLENLARQKIPGAKMPGSIYREREKFADHFGKICRQLKENGRRICAPPNVIKSLPEQ